MDSCSHRPHGPSQNTTLALLRLRARNQVFTTLYPATAISAESRADLARNVQAAFGEITLPIFGKDNGGRGYRRLEFSVAGRYEHYSDFGQATNPKLGLVWSPIDAVAFRGTWGRSIRAPTLTDLDTSRNFLIPYTLSDKSSPSGFSKEGGALRLESISRTAIGIRSASRTGR
jgi:outer membrane receptor protein involved in Fe transport